MVLKKYMVSLYNALGVYLPLITTNCAVLGAVSYTHLTRDTDWAIEAHDPINEMLKQLYQMINQLGQLDKSIILDRKSTRLNSSHSGESRMPSSA